MSNEHQSGGPEALQLNAGLRRAVDLPHAFEDVPQSDERRKAAFYCLFCGRHDGECRTMIASPGAAICDVCVGVCNDVLAYLDAKDCALALDNIAALTRNAVFLGILTADDEGQYDRARTDPEQHLRPAAWYRRRLARHFVSVGGGLYLKRPLQVTVWTMDRTS